MAGGVVNIDEKVIEIESNPSRCQKIKFLPFDIDTHQRTTTILY